MHIHIHTCVCGPEGADDRCRELRPKRGNEGSGEIRPKGVHERAGGRDAQRVHDGACLIILSCDCVLIY